MRKHRSRGCRSALEEGGGGGSRREEVSTGSQVVALARSSQGHVLRAQPRGLRECQAGATETERDVRTHVHRGLCASFFM